MTIAAPAIGRRRSDVFDAVVAVACAGLSLQLAATLLPALPNARKALLIGLLLAHSLCLSFRRRRPVATVSINLVSGLAVLAGGLPMVVLGLAPLIALYTVALCCQRRPTVLAWLAALLALVLGEAADGFAQDVATLVTDAVALTAAAAAGRFVHARIADLRALDAKNRELEAAREDLAHAAVTEERLRMARELHDIVAHSLSMIAVQAGAGAHVAAEDPEASRRSLEAIGQVSRQALIEMRGVVKMLRDEADPELSPLPGLAALGGLVEQVASSGLRVDLVQTNPPARDLPVTLDTTAYRIVQESLTNVVRHANATAVRVRVSYTATDLRIEVVDDGVCGPTSLSGGGHGLTGMRERAQHLGGTLVAGPLRDGGFRVAADLPIPGAVA